MSPVVWWLDGSRKASTSWSCLWLASWGLINPAQGQVSLSAQPWYFGLRIFLTADIGKKTIRGIIARTEVGCCGAGQKGRRKRAGVSVDLSREATVSPCPAERRWGGAWGREVEQEGSFSPGTCSEKYGGRENTRAATLLVGIFHNKMLFGRWRAQSFGYNHYGGWESCCWVSAGDANRQDQRLRQDLHVRGSLHGSRYQRHSASHLAQVY